LQHPYRLAAREAIGKRGVAKAHCPAYSLQAILDFGVTSVGIDGPMNPLHNPLDTSVLPPGIRSRFVDGVNGLRVHILEAGFDHPGRPLVFMLHGFPEIAYSWRKVMPSVAAAGFHVVAPDLRGYGRTTGWSADYDADLRPFRILNLVRDTLGLAFALGHR